MFYAIFYENLFQFLFIVNFIIFSDVYMLKLCLFQESNEVLLDRNSSKINEGIGSPQANLIVHEIEVYFQVHDEQNCSAIEMNPIETIEAYQWK